MDAAGGTRAVADAMGVSSPTVRQWATGNKAIPPVRLNQLRKLARQAESGGGDQAAEATTSERPRGLRGDGATAQAVPVVNVPAGKTRKGAAGGLWPFNVGQSGRASASAPVLTKTEAEALREGVMRFLSAMGDYADEGIAITNKRREKPAIWSAMDDEELGTLADFLIARGMRSGVAAATVRNMARTWEAFQVGIILWPRFRATIRFYADNGGFAL